MRLLLAPVLLCFTPALAMAEDPIRGPGPARDGDCQVCHAGAGEEEAPKLDLALYGRSIHSKEGCIGCHEDVEDPDIAHEEEDQDLEAVACGRCHESIGRAYEASAHGELGRVAKDDGTELEFPNCARCHGSHDIRPTAHPEARVHPNHQADTCGECHGEDRPTVGHDRDLSALARPDLTPGEAAGVEALRAGGQLVAAACTDCHLSHDTLPPTAPRSALYPSRVAETCRPCHQDETDAFSSSAHHQVALKDGFSWQDFLQVSNSRNDNHHPGDHPSPEEDVAPPVCITCHRMHEGRSPTHAEFRTDIIHECGTCHSHLMQTYVESYHGKATLLGDGLVAKCSDCHGYHAVLGAKEPASAISPENKLETCQKCHEGAPPGFAGFWAHADHDDAERYPVLYWVYRFMTLLLTSVLSFFGLHTLLWGLREAVDALRLRQEAKRVYQGPRVRRFSTLDRFLHFLVIISFLGLAATGAPLKFAEASWAPVVFQLMGGVSTAGLLHRIFAVVTFVYFFGHLAQLAYTLLPEFRQGRLFKSVFGPDSLVPRLSDISDVIAHFGWFLGLRGKPTWERWTYWEKFDYWAVFWGVAIIGSSGLILWFPSFFTQFLPGWLINVALVVHSDEALLAIGFIFGVHFFNSHLRRAKFPMDEVIFTGSMPEEEYREERGREWARMEAEGRVEGRLVEVPNPVFRTWARVFGILAWLTGLIILALIIHGFITTH